MSAAVVLSVTCDSTERAAGALAALEGAADEGAVCIDDAAVVARDADGRVAIRQTRQLAVGEGLVAGGAIGLLVGVALGGPIGGAVAGMVGGGAWSTRDTGLSDARLAELGLRLDPGCGALLALVREVEWALVVGRLRPYALEVGVGDVPADVAAALAEP